VIYPALEAQLRRHAIDTGLVEWISEAEIERIITDAIASAVEAVEAAH
jgi:hypothetical protein